MDFLNNLINNIRNYFAPQQTQAPVNAVQPGQGPIAPVQQGIGSLPIDYNAVAGQPIQEIQLPEIQLPQIQTGPIAPIQQTIDYNQAIAGQPITPLPTIDFNAVASQPITQAQPFQLGTTEQYTPTIVQEQPTLQQLIQQQLIQQQQVPQGQTIGAPITAEVGAGTMAQTETPHLQQGYDGINFQTTQQTQEEIDILAQRAEQKAQAQAEIDSEPPKQTSLDELVRIEQAKVDNASSAEQLTKEYTAASQYINPIVAGYGIGLREIWRGIKDITGIEKDDVKQAAYGQYYKIDAPQPVTYGDIKSIKDQKTNTELYDSQKKYWEQIVTPLQDTIGRTAVLEEKGILPKGSTDARRKEYQEIVNGLGDAQKIALDEVILPALRNGKSITDAGVDLSAWAQNKGYINYNQYLNQSIVNDNIAKAKENGFDITKDIPALSKTLYASTASPQDLVKTLGAYQSLWEFDSSSGGFGGAVDVLNYLVMGAELGAQTTIRGARRGLGELELFKDVPGVGILTSDVLTEADSTGLKNINESPVRKYLNSVQGASTEFATFLATVWATNGISIESKVPYLLGEGSSVLKTALNGGARAINWMGKEGIKSQIVNSALMANTTDLKDARFESLLNVPLDVGFEAILKGIGKLGINVGIGEILDSNTLTDALRTTIAKDNLIKKYEANILSKLPVDADDALKQELLNDNPYIPKSSELEAEKLNIKKVTRQQLDEYSTIATGALRAMNNLPEATRATLFKEGIGLRMLEDMIGKYRDGDTDQLIKINGLLSDIADVNMGSSTLIARALGTARPITTDFDAYNPLGLDQALIDLQKSGVKDVPSNVKSVFGDNFNPTAKIDNEKLAQFSVQNNIPVEGMVDSRGYLTEKGIRDMGITLDGEILAKIASRDTNKMLLVDNLASATGKPTYITERTLDKVDKILSIVCA